MNPLMMAAQADPLAAVRRLKFMTQAQDGDFISQMLMAGAGGAPIIDPSMLDAFNASGLQSKYSNFTLNPDGSISGTLQRPGGSKYDTMTATWAPDGAGGYSLSNDPFQFPTQQRSSADSWKDMAEQVGALAAVMGGAYALGPTVAATEAGIGALGTLPNVAPAMGAMPAIGSAGISGALPAVSAAGSALGGSTMGASAMNWGWLKDVGSSLAGPLVSGLIQDRAAGKAADAMRAGTEAGIGEQQRQFDLTRSDLAPYRDVATWALPQLKELAGGNVTPQEVMSDPGYQFGMDESMRALNQRIAAMGGRVSGNAIKGAIDTAGNYATKRYGEAYQRRMDRIRTLQSLAGIGQNAVNAGAGFGQNTANAISGMVTSQGDANAARDISRGNIYSDLINQGWAAYNRRGRGMDTGNYDPYGYPNGGP